MRKITFLLFFIVQFSYAQCWEMVKTDGASTMAIKKDGTLWGWGLNDTGQLGNGTFVNELTPKQIGNSTDWAFLSRGYHHTLAIKNGSLWSFGWNLRGQLGDGTTINKNIPVQVGNSNSWKICSSGFQHNLAIKTDGTLWAWGRNDVGQLGDGSYTDKYIPTQIGISNDWKNISAAEHHSIAIKNNGTMWSWGLGNLLGSGSPTTNIPTQVGTSSDWFKVSAGYVHNLAIKNDGTLWSWGNNYYGALGNGSTTVINTVLPIQVGTDNNWVDISAGNFFSVGLKKDGTLWTWGWNFYGSLGDGTTTDKLIPTQIGKNKYWKYIEARLYQAMAIETEGKLYAWGYNEYGQIGDGTIIQKNTFIYISCSLVSNEEFNTIPVNIYPNPSNSKINIECENVITSLIIYDLNGRVVKTQFSADSQIDISSLQQGIYFLKVQTQSGTNTQKIIKN